VPSCAPCTVFARLFAIVDKKDWLCKTCSSKLEGEAAAQSTDVKLLQKENDYLMREKWLQDKLILTLEVCNKQLQDKLEDSKNLHQGSSYSAVVKKQDCKQNNLVSCANSNKNACINS
jgi:hypothetical protein